MEKWIEINENRWQNEAALISINVLRSRSTRPWKIVLAGRNVFETLPGSFNLNACKAAATKIARRYLRDLAEVL